MKKTLTLLLQIAIVLFGLGTLALMLWFPNIEGRNVNSTLFEVYFNDPFLVYAYTASIAYFIGLWNIFKIVGYIREKKINSKLTSKALQNIKHCAMTIIAFVMGALGYLALVVSGTDDIAGGVALGLFIIIGSTVVATTSNLFQRRLQRV